MALHEEGYKLYVLHVRTQPSWLRRCGRPVPTCVDLKLSFPMPITPMIPDDTACLRGFCTAGQASNTKRHGPTKVSEILEDHPIYLNVIHHKGYLPVSECLVSNRHSLQGVPARISHRSVAGSDDRPDVLTRDANTHKLYAIPTHMWGTQNTPAGSGVKGRGQESSRTAPYGPLAFPQL